MFPLAKKKIWKFDFNKKAPKNPPIPPDPDGDPKPKDPGFLFEVIGDKAAYKSGTPCPHVSL